MEQLVKPQIQQADVAIAGAGPAGLGCALNMAKRGLRVIVFEKERLGLTLHSWVIPDSALKDYHLTDHILQRIESMTFSCYLGASYTLNEKFASAVDEEGLLLGLAGQARRAKGRQGQGEEAQP